MKKLIFICLALFHQLSFAQTVNCDDDQTFYEFNGTRPIPAVNCPSVLLITSKHRQSIAVHKSKSDSLIILLKAEKVALLASKKIQDDLVKRKDGHIDSLETFIKEKNLQAQSLDSIAHQSLTNTEKAVHIAKTNRALAYISVIGAIATIILLELK